MLKRFLFSYVLLCLLPFLLLGTLVSSITAEMVREELLNAAEISLNESTLSIRNLAEEARNLALAIAVDPEVQRALEQLQDTAGAGEAEIQALQQGMQKIPLYGNTGLKAKVAVRLPGAVAADSLPSLIEPLETETAAPWLQEAIEEPNQFLWSLQVLGTGTYLRQAKAIYDMQTWDTILGYALVDIHVEKLRSIAMDTTTTASRLYVVERDGTILYPYYNYDKIPEEALRANTQQTFSHGESLLLLRPVPGTNWKLIKSLSLSEINDKTASVQRTILWVALVFLVLSLCAALYYYTRIARPIGRLGRRMQRVQTGELIPIPGAPPAGEIGALYKSYNYMVYHLKEQIDRTYVSQIHAKEAELKALQAQINPHFLYNTLDSISWLALRYHAEDISEMVIALSDMLRLSLNKGETIILLRDELRQVESYITLQKIRYSNRFDATYEVEEAAKDCRVVKMLLQPLVENAIIHGFDEMESGGHIHIHIWLEDGLLHLEVQNNGALIDLARLEQRMEEQHQGEFMHGYGIRNVNERLASYYGPQYRIAYHIQDGRTIATIVIPQEVSP